MNNNFVLLGKDVEIGNNCVFDKMRSTSNQGSIKFGDYSKIHVTSVIMFGLGKIP